MPKIDIAKYTKQNCNWYAKTGYDKFGKPAYSTSNSIKCRYTPKQQLIKDKAGKETMSKGVFLIFEAWKALYPEGKPQPIVEPTQPIPTLEERIDLIQTALNDLILGGV